ncbi:MULTISPECIES: hypothetical protein [unclassified Nonomuraea]|uniref:hypothetical protein n=1 Tax=unclassified Nonomuraea TaxID=2593643 RepID=UPI0033F8B606
MAGASNSFDGGSNGTAITPANSGSASGTAFSATDSITYSSAQAYRGPLSAQIAAGAIGYVQYALSGTGTRWARWYARPVSPSNSLIEMALANGDMFGLDISGGQIILWRNTNFNQNNLDTKTFTLPGGWIRLEMQANSDNSGSATARIFTAPEASTPAIELSGSDVAVASSWDAVRFGSVNESSTPGWIDSVAWSDQGWIGPLPGTDVATPRIPRAATHRAAAW